jgi:hypothetical protein
MGAATQGYRPPLVTLDSRGAPGPVAQLAEQGTFNPKVAGSNPARPIRSGMVQIVTRLVPLEQSFQSVVIEAARLTGWRVAHFRAARTAHG